MSRLAAQTVRPRAVRAAKDGSRDLANLDFLRALAVLLVFAGHLAETMKIRGLGDIGHFGVLLFFVHTSLVLMLSLGRLRGGGLGLSLVFLFRRVFRIYPLSLLAVLACAAFRIPPASWGAGFEWIGWPAFVSNLLLTQNITHDESILSVLWSLPFEMQMYLALPPLFLMLRRTTQLKAAGWIWLLGITIATAEFAFQPRDANTDFLLTRYVPCFLAGVFAWRLMVNRPQRFPGLVWIVFLLGLTAAYRAVDVLRVYGPAAFGALHGAVRNDHLIWWPRFLDLVRDWAFCAVTAVMLPLFFQIRLRAVNRVSRRIALYSYGIYLVHVPAMWLCFDRFHASSLIAAALLSTGLTAALAILLYHVIEHPAIELGKRLSAGFAAHPTLT